MPLLSVIDYYTRNEVPGEFWNVNLVNYSKEDVLDVLDVLHNNFIVNFIVYFLNIDIFNKNELFFKNIHVFSFTNKVGLSFLKFIPKYFVFLWFELL